MKKDKFDIIAEGLEALMLISIPFGMVAMLAVAVFFS